MDDAFPGGQGFPDLHAVADLATRASRPGSPTRSWLLADLREPGGRRRRSACAACCARVTERLRARGLTRHGRLRAGVLRRCAWTRTALIEHYSPLAGMAYTTGVRADPSGLVRRIHARSTRSGSA